LDLSLTASCIDGGRIVSIIDKGPAGIIGKTVPDKWMLEARDAFNGVLLWEHPVPDWGWRQWKPELEELEDWSLTAHRRLIPITLPRRLVTIDGLVYVTMGVRAPVTAFDGATGKTVRKYKGTEGTDEILYKDGILYLTVRPDVREISFKDKKPSLKELASKKPVDAINEAAMVMAVDAKSGKVIWKTDTETVIPYTLATDGKRIVYHTGKELKCLDGNDGKVKWNIAETTTEANRWNVHQTLLLYKDIVLISLPTTKCQAYDLNTGKLLWSGKGGRRTAFSASPIDMFVIDDLLWFTSGQEYQGLDVHTGEVKKTLDLPTYFHSPGHHLRCYRAKATSRYILDNKRGIEFMDITGKKHQKNDWVRGACRYGIIPANGLIYSTPTPCSCYQTVQLKGFNALSSKATVIRPENLVFRGSAYGQVRREPADKGSWPTLRGDNSRQGISTEKPGADLKSGWQRKLGGKITQPIVAGGRLYVVSRSQNKLYALDAGDGSIVWEYDTPAEVDSSPTYHEGLLIFGGRDGYVYCLRASDGKLVWVFRAAPDGRQIVSYGRLESSWPVHGNVLVLKEAQRDVVYFAAGRNTYLDSGIYIMGIDAFTGKGIYRRHLVNEPMDNEKPYQPHELEGAMPDIFVFDGKYLSMQSKVFDRKLNSVELPDKPHIYATGGFLDDNAWHRNFWLYAPGWTRMNKLLNTFPNTGQLLCHDGNLTYGVKYFTEKSGQSRIMFPEEKGYYLFCDKDSEMYDDLLLFSESPEKKKASSRSEVKDWEEADSRVWSKWIPVRVRAMVKTAENLFVCGPADVIPKDDPMAPFQGRAKGQLWAVDAGSGEKLAEYTLDSSPVFDGMIAAYGKLYFSLEDGSVACWQGK
jgi:outer membrane protein assembly factor BamB